MVQPSPAPRRVRRPWRWVGLGVAVLGVGAALTVASYPAWADGMVERRVIEALERRFAAPVSIGDLDLEYDRVDIRNLQIGGTSASIRLDHVVVELDDEALWSARAKVERVTARGGEIEGERADLEALVRRAAPSESTATAAEGSWLRKRVAATPRRLELEGLELAVTETLADGRSRSVSGSVHASADPREKTADLTLRDAQLELSSGKTARADRLHVALEPGAEGSVAFPLTVDLEGAATALTPRIAVAAVDGTVELSDASASQLTVALTGGFSDESGEAGEPGLWSVAGSVRRDMSAGQLTVDMEKFELGRVPQVLARLPVVESESATVAGHVEVDFGNGVARANGEVVLAGLNVSHDLLARQVVHDVGFQLAFDAQLDPAARKLTLEEAVISRGPVAARIDGEFVHGVEQVDRRYRARIQVPPVPCQEVLAAIPVELVPSLDGFELRGDFDMDLRIDIDYADLDALELGGKVGLTNCAVRRAPHAVSMDRLAAGFTHRVTMRDGSQRSVQLYPNSGTYTSFDQISPHMVAAVLTTEDGGFWRHRGFLPSQFEEALRRNLRAGEIRLGASTITMQMTKNVFLKHERTLSRKLQEMVLTWYVESALSKRRIMEIYLNVIEFGPGIYGVTRAADHYFGKHPRDLSSLESAYLALMLPSPVRRHVHYCKDQLSPRMQTKLRRIHGLMFSRGRIEETEYLMWKDAELVFDPSERGDEARCLGYIDRLLNATKGQKALTGLLREEGAAIDDEPLELSPPAPIPLPSVDQEPGEDLAPVPDDPANPDSTRRPAMDEDVDVQRPSQLP